MTWISYHISLVLHSSPNIFSLCMYSPLSTVICPCNHAHIDVHMYMDGADGRDRPRSRLSQLLEASAPSRLLSFGAPLSLLLCIRTVSYASAHPVERPIHAYSSSRVCCRLGWVESLYRRNTGGWRAVSSCASLFQSSFHIHILLETRIPFLFPGIWFFFLSLDSAFSLFLSLPYLCFINKQHYRNGGSIRPIRHHPRSIRRSSQTTPSLRRQPFSSGHRLHPHGNFCCRWSRRQRKNYSRPKFPARWIQLWFRRVRRHALCRAGAHHT